MIKNHLSKVLEEIDKNEFIRFIELVVLLPATSYVVLRYATPYWNLSLNNCWILALPSIASGLYGWLSNKIKV
jgi:hypothetical protein